MPKPKLHKGVAKKNIVGTRVNINVYNGFINYCTNKNMKPSKILRLFILDKIKNNA